MRRTLQANRPRSQRGAIAVEAAIVLPILVAFFALPSIPWALFFYKYSAAEKAAHDAALYLSTAPKLEMTTAGPGGDPVAVTLAKNIIAKELAGLNPTAPSIVCIYKQSSGFSLSAICTTDSNLDYTQPLIGFYVKVGLRYVDPVTGMKIAPYANVPYAGN